MKSRRLLLAFLLAPGLARADALGALGFASAVADLLMLMLGVLGAAGLGVLLVRRPRWRGLHYLLGLPLLLGGDAYLNHPAPGRLLVLLGVLLLNGLSWRRSFLPTPVRWVGLLAIAGAGIGLLSTLLAHY